VPDAGPRELADGKLLIDEPADAVVRLTISNPAKRNALDHPLLDAITATLEELSTGDGRAPGARGAPARCIVVTGAHGMFSAGYDIGEIPDEAFEEQAESLVAHPFTAAIDALEAFPYPTLAVLPGPTIGGGLELALACDLRIARQDIKLGMPPAKLGLVYSHTGLRRFLDAIGAPRTRELFLVGRRIDARTAREWGLVNAIVEEGRIAEEAVELATEIASNAPLAEKGNKRVIRAVLSAQGAMDPETERELIELRRACFASEDFREGVRAFSEKRAPRWRGR